MRLLAGCLLCAAGLAQQTYFSVPAPDAPELAPQGRYSVGVRTLDLVHKDQVDILHFDPKTGKAPLYDRPLTVEVWYPATIPAGRQERTEYPSVTPSGQPFRLPGKALRDAPALTGETFPLVIVSHGYPGNRVFLSYLTENLASKGYVVAAIDHTDSVVGQVRPFPSTLLNRSADQLFTIEELGRRQDLPLDATRAAVVGYSMGGYGALASAGAGYSRNSMETKIVPGGYFDDWIAGSPKFAGRERGPVKAVVAIAPWGAQPPFNSWDAAGLAGVRIPSLFIVGDHDDVSGYSPGVKTAFEGAVNSDRCLLVYENARHNVGGNPPPPGLDLDFTGLEHYNEPVWRKERITAINQHFITAFLDLVLKGDEAKRDYLHGLTAKSGDGQWPVPQGQSVGAAYSSGISPVTVWKGFHRRFDVGLEMHCLAPAR